MVPKQGFLTIALEVAGPAAMFTRPDTGVTMKLFSGMKKAGT